MTAVRDEILETMPPLRGVVHAAGVVDDGMLVHQTWARWRAVLHGKVGGARVLDALTRDLSLDFFVLYSSAGVAPRACRPGRVCRCQRGTGRDRLGQEVVGTPGAQRRLGAMAGSRDGRADGQRRHRPVEHARARLARSTGIAFAQLERLLSEGATHAAILPIDWHRFLSRLPAGVDADFFSAVAPREAGHAPPPVAPLRRGRRPG